MKTWSDSNNQDGKRANVGAKFQLYRKVSETSTADLGNGAVPATDGEVKVWEGLPVYEGGVAIKYYVVETKTGTTASEYTATGDGESTGIEATEIADLGTITVTNSYAAKTTKIHAAKTWSDSNNQDGKRANVGAKFQLYKKVGETSTAVGEAVDVPATDGEVKVWEGLPVYEGGVAIKYYVVETKTGTTASEYTATGDGESTGIEATEIADLGTITVTNSHTPETKAVTITKVWEDSSNKFNTRKAIQLILTGKAEGTTVVTETYDIAADAIGDTQSHEFMVPVYANGGKVIGYTVDETGELPGYKKSIDQTTLTVTNKYEPTPVEESIPVKKVLTIPEGLTGPKEWSYGITATAIDDAPEAATMTGTISKSTKDGAIAIGPITFTMPGTYSYTVSESGTIAGVKNDDDAAGKTATITVADNGEGKLTITEVTGVTFTNTYDAKVIVKPKEDKTKFGVKNLTKTTEDNLGHDFTFTLSAGKNTAAGNIDTPMPASAEGANGTVSYVKDETGKKIIPFDEITYTRTGTYYYTITEDTKAYTKEKGWTVTDNPVDVTVTVGDNGDGTLSASVVFGTITNRYDAEVTIDPTKTETLFGKKNLTKTTEDGKDQTFSFTLTAGANTTAAKLPTPMPASTAASVTYEAGKTGEQIIPFGKITYKAVGEYNYTITEADAGKGWKTTGSPVAVKVVVTDNGDGTLSAAVTGGTITNEYNAEITIDPTDEKAETVFGKKNLTKTTEDGKAQTFSFTLTAGTNTSTAKLPTPMPTSATTAAASVTYKAGEIGEQIIPFGKITYKAAGEYNYTITEAEAGKGWTTSGSPVSVKVVVTDNGDGTLSAAVTGGAIENAYNAEITIDPTDEEAKTVFGRKNLTKTTEDGKDQTFSFTLTAGTNTTTDKLATPMPTSTAASVTYEAGKTGEQVIPFGKITYKAAGEYNYTITEAAMGKGWTTSGSPVSVKVVVTDNGDGTLSAAVTGGAIENAYNAEITIDPTDEEAKTVFGKKNLTKTTEDGKAQTFSFTLTAGTNTTADKLPTPMPASAAASVSYEAGKTGEQVIPFGKITYKAAGTYEYTITEADAGKGWTTTGSPVTVKVVVTDNGDGTLSAAVTGGAIENAYNAEITIDPTDEVAKTVFGRKNLTKTTEDGEAQKFDFTLAAVTTGAPMPASAAASVSYEAGKTGEQVIPFGKITYKAAGTYEYTITEADAGKGWTTTGSPATVKVVVTDNGDGTLSAAVTGGAIENAYNAEITIDPTDEEAKTVFGEKNLVKTTEDGEGQKFDFTLAAVTTGAPMPASAAVSVSYAADETGSKVIPFGKITYKAAGTYEYTITEADAGDGWTTSGSPVTVKVEVTDNGDGTLSAAVTGGTIENTYDAEITIDPTDEEAETVFGKKNLAKTTQDGKDHEFSFTLAAEDGAPMPEGATASVSYEAAETGVKVIPFGKITYTAAGTYKYTITEDTEGYTAETGWTVTNSPVTVTVEVTDNGDGTLDAQVTGGEITNEYNAEPVVVDPTDTATLFGRKNLILVKGDGEAYSFNFTLKAETAGAPMPGTPTATVNYAANEAGTKTIPFGKITFTEVGEFEYSISEVVGNYKPEYGWIITDNDTKVKVTVTDNGEGQLTAAVSGTETITNSYTYQTVNATINKVWNDNNNAAGRRPVKLTVQLKNGNTTVQEAELNAANNWSITVNELPKFADGKEITYSWTEEAVVGYTLESNTTVGQVTTLTNRVTGGGGGPATYNVTVRYEYLDGRPAAPTAVVNRRPGENYSIDSPGIPNYTPTIKTVQGTMPNHDVTVVVLYIPGDNLVPFDEYDTPLGLGNVSLNIGDCYE
ncbi:Cna B-type domain-containing protein [Clostridiales bacterium]|nr:Cna B-type domain-containing protein [Clostridiales bacterium]